MKKIFKVATLMLLLVATAAMTIGCGPNKPKPNNAVLTEIRIIDDPVKTAYDVDEAATVPATKGMVIKAFYDNGSQLDKADFSGAEWSFDVYEATLNSEGNYEATLDGDGNKLPSDLRSEGDKAVTVSYTENEVTKTADFFVKVTDGSKYVGIKIKNKPQEKYEFKNLSTGLQLGGLLVEILLDSDGNGIFEDGVDGVVPVYDFEDPFWKDKFDFKDFDLATKRGTYPIRVVYDRYKNDPTKTNPVEATYDIEVTADVSSISVATSPTKTKYIIGERLDLTGLEIAVNYEDGGTDTIGNIQVPSENWRIDNFNTGNATAKLTLDVTYRLSGQDKASTTYDIKVFHVKGLELDPSLKATGDPSLVYFVGETKLYDYLLNKPVTLTLIAAEPEGKDPVTQEPIFPAVGPEDIDTRPDVLRNCGILGAPTDANPLSAIGAVPLTAVYTTGEGVSAKDSFALSVVDTYKFTSAIEKVESGNFPSISVFENVIDYNETLYGGFAPPLTVTTSELKFVKFGDYPQSIAKIGKADEVIEGKPFIYETEERKKTMGGLDMYLGNDGGYYVKVESARRGLSTADNKHYKFSDGTTWDGTDGWDGKECWFRVEPLIWRVLTTDYNNTGNALLWSLRAIDRIPYFADSESPDCDNTNGDYAPGGGKLPRDMVINGQEVKVRWQSYKYSTLRAFLRGEYELEDPQAEDTYKQIYTGGSDTVAGNDLTKFPVYPVVDLPKFTGKGFLQTAFAFDAADPNDPLNCLKEVEIDAATRIEGSPDIPETLTDSVFVLSEEELSNPAPDFYFVSQEFLKHATYGNGMAKHNAQMQRRKQVTDYSMARESKRWSNTINGETQEYPGGNVWTRTVVSASEGGVIALTGHGRIEGCGRGNYKAQSVVPAICVDQDVINALSW